MPGWNAPAGVSASGNYHSLDNPVPHKCHNCGTEWEACMFYEWGGWFYHDDEKAFCPKCGHDDLAHLLRGDECHKPGCTATA